MRLLEAKAVLLRSKVMREAAWVAGGQVASAIAALLSIRIMTELLKPDEFGRLTLLVGVAALALGLSATPRLQAAMRYYPDADRSGRICALRVTAVRLIAPLVAIFCTILAVGWLAFGSRLGDAWFAGLLVAALLVVDCIRSLEIALFNAARRQREASVIYAADAWSRPLMAMAAVFLFGSSAESALAGYVAGSAMVVLAMRLLMRLEGAERGGEIERRDDSALAASMRRYAWPLAPLAVFGWLSGVGDRYVIAGLLNLHDAGLYAAAYGLASRPFLMLSGVVELTMRPILQNAVAVGNTGLIARAKSTWLLIMAAGVAFGLVCFVLLSKWVGHLLLAEQYRSATALMPWIALGYALLNLATVFTRFCYAFDATKAVLLLTTAGGVLGIAIMFPVIRFYGLPGAAAAVSAGFGVQLVLAWLLARRSEHRLTSQYDAKVADA